MMSLQTTSDSNMHRMMIITTDETILHQIKTNYDSSSVQTVILNPNNNEDLSLSDTTRSKQKSLICAVCDGTASGRHFGVAACESCKLFFRRNGLKDLTKLPCENNNQCEIKVGTPRRCLSCRLKKCLECGMKQDRLLKAEEKAGKLRRGKIKVVGQLSSDTSVSLKLDYTQNLTSIEHIMYRNLLTVDDLARIDIIRLAFENRIELAAQDGFEHGPIPIAQNILEHLNTHSVAALRLLAFFKQIPEFNQVKINDKMILIKYNLMHVIVLNNAASFKPMTDKLHQTDGDVPLNVQLLERVHGQSIFPDLQRIFRPILQIARTDMKIFPIVFIVFILLKGLSAGEGIPEPILEDGISVFCAQNIFAELLWKYLETNYGFHTATRIMSTIITKFMSWQVYYLRMRFNVNQVVSLTDENRVLPLMKSIFHI